MQDLESKELSDMVKPLLAALQLPDDWLAMGSSSVMKRRGGYKGPLPSRAKNAPPKPCVKTASKARDVLKFLIVDPKEDKEREEENSTAPSQHRVWSEDGENILDLVPKRELSVTIAAFPSNIKAARNFPSTIFESISRYPCLLQALQTGNIQPKPPVLPCRPVSGISGLFSHPIGDDWQSEDEHSQSDRQTNADEDDTSDFVIRDGQAFCVGG